MKKQLITLALAFISIASISAQTQTLFNRARVVGGFGAPITEIGLDDNYNTSIGGGGGLLINSFFIGGYGMGSLDFEKLLAEDGDIESMELGHGGIWLGFSVPTHKLIHFYGSARVGWGAIDIQFVTRWFKLAGTVGYRYLDGANSDSVYTNDDFRGAFAGITLRFGGFGSRWNNDNW
jgi:hypothetical protein